jgi:methyl-accepting chemotaxis protein
VPIRVDKPSCRRRQRRGLSISEKNMAFWTHWRLRQKFALAAVLAVGMSALPATLAVQDSWKAMVTAQREVQGLAPSAALLKLLRVTQKHRGLSAAQLAGNAEATAKRGAVEAEVGQAMQATAEAIAPLGVPALSQQLDTLRGQWKQLAEAVGQKSLEAPASFARHTALIDGQLDLLRDVTDAAGMSLDSNAATHHAITATLTHLPRLTEALGQLRARGATVLQKQAATPADRARIESLMTLARYFDRNARHALTRLQQTDARMAEGLEGARQQANTMSEQSLALVQEAILSTDSLTHPSAAYFDRTTAAIDAQFALIDRTFELVRQDLDDRAASDRRTLWLLGATLVGLGALSLGLLTAIIRSTLQGIDTALAVARTVASGDLSMRIESTRRDETGDLLTALKSMNDSLVNLVGQVRDSSEQIATGAGQIASGNADLSQRTEEQASNLQQTAASMEQLNASVKSNADSARQAASMAQAASGVARQGGQDMAAVVSTMEAISDASRRIGDIIGVIDGIAFQTNILALNAAVEAARAGEHGRGFAVVAGEVRSLAQRSAQAAREIKSLIQTSSERVEAGMRQVTGAGATMDQIVAEVQRVDGLINEIGEATQQQAGGIGQVGDAIDQLDQVTQQNAALVEESAAAAESLHAQATRLVAAVGRFRLTPA